MEQAPPRVRITGPHSTFKKKSTFQENEENPHLVSFFIECSLGTIEIP